MSTRRVQWGQTYFPRIEELDVDSGTKALLKDIVNDIQANFDYIQKQLSGQTNEITGLTFTYKNANGKLISGTTITVKNGEIIGLK
ncbi:MAG TPA: hypothetical protein VKI62_00750 [Bacteroidota bacterium]|nr:hypothetical protein [Bacteroidota bacterium]